METKEEEGFKDGIEFEKERVLKMIDELLGELIRLKEAIKRELERQLFQYKLLTELIRINAKIEVLEELKSKING